MQHSATVLRCVWPCRPVGAAVVAAMALVGGLHAQPPERVRRSLPAVRTDQPPKIDGRLDDACWQDAPQATDFTDPFTERPANDQTVARLVYDDAGIYVAIHAFDAVPGKIVGRQTKDQTRPQGEDYVAFGLDPFHTHQFGDRNFFIVNPLGAKYAHLAAGRAEKAEWLGLWKAAAQRTEDGWAVEMEIPWQMLAYPDAGAPTTMGINFDRRQQRTGEKSWWSNIGLQEFNELDGHWVGVLPPPKTRDLRVLPYTYAGRDPGLEDDLAARAGLDVRYALTSQITLVGTVNPDFQNVEQAVEGVDFSYGARFVPDRRPFFREGRNVLNTWEYYHSRRIPEVDAGLSIFGKADARTSVGALGTFARDGEDNLLLRATHTVSDTTNVGGAYFAHAGEGETNHVAFLEGETRYRKVSVGANFAQTFLGAEAQGRKMRGRLSYQGGRTYAGVFPFFVDEEFVNALGFHPFTGIRGAEAGVFRQREWRSGRIRRVMGFVNGAVANRYDGSIFRRRVFALARLETHSDYGVSVSGEAGRFEEHRDRVLNVHVGARSSDQFTNYGIGASWGRRGGRPYRSLAPSASIRAGALTTALSAQWVRLEEDVFQHILTFNYDFSPALSVGGRLIWQDAGRNVYFALRRSGYAGTDVYVIIGDPNTETFQRRFIAKVVHSF